MDNLKIKVIYLCLFGVIFSSIKFHKNEDSHFIAINELAEIKLLKDEDGFPDEFHIYIKESEDNFEIACYQNGNFKIFEKHESLIQVKDINEDSLLFIPFQRLLGKYILTVHSIHYANDDRRTIEFTDVLNQFEIKTFKFDCQKPYLDKLNTVYQIACSLRNETEVRISCDEEDNKICDYRFVNSTINKMGELEYELIFEYPICDTYIDKTVVIKTNMGSSVIKRTRYLSNLIPPYDIKFFINNNEGPIYSHKYFIPNIEISQIPKLLNMDFTESYTLNWEQANKLDNNDILSVDKLYYLILKNFLNFINEYTNHNDYPIISFNKFLNDFESVIEAICLDVNLDNEKCMNSIKIIFDTETLYKLVPVLENNHLKEIVNYYEDIFDDMRVKLDIKCSSSSRENGIKHIIRNTNNFEEEIIEESIIDFVRKRDLSNWTCTAIGSKLQATTDPISIKLVEEPPKTPLIIVYNQNFQQNNKYKVDSNKSICILVFTASSSKIRNYRVERLDQQTKTTRAYEFNDPVICLNLDSHKSGMIYKVYVVDESSISLPTIFELKENSFTEIINNRINVKYTIIACSVLIILATVTILVVVLVNKKKINILWGKMHRYNELVCKEQEFDELIAHYELNVNSYQMKLGGSIGI